ncbi:Asp23/Gls24 family envelope stress response protein [Clavibacter michiganensis]|nr:Asp23/Gls24 family envelope stress response protein [Clavibacter michiganensis]PPF62467.1 Asp23/Gls24 family envelope stress response protein [Clavibacter michiganensis]
MASTSTSNVATPASVSTPTNLQTALGRTVINDGVVAKVAGIAAREVSGVFALGGGAARALGAIRGAMNSTDLSQGISVEVGETQVAVDVTIVAEYPAPLQQVADGVRASIISAVEALVGMEVTEVNVTIVDVHIASDDDNEPEAEARVL